MEKTYLCKYLNEGQYCVLSPVYYDHETRPAWRKWFIGTKEEAENALKAAPEYITATPEENKTMRTYRRQEYLLLLNHGKKKEAAEINAIYHFN